MSASVFTGLLDLATGLVLVSAIIALWRHDLHAIVSALALQGCSLGVVAGVIAYRDRDIALATVSVLVIFIKGLLIPALLRQLVRRDPGSRETHPVVNVSASLVVSAALIIVAFLAGGKITAVMTNGSTRLASIGLSTVLIGFFLLVTRRRAVSQIVGLLLIDNGIALVAFLLTAGIPLIIELGASLDLLLIVLVLRVLATAIHQTFGSLDLDNLQEVRD